MTEEGGFGENTAFQYIEDWELCLRLSREGKIWILAESLLKYRMHQRAGRETRQLTLNVLKIMKKYYNLRFMDKKAFRSARCNYSVVIGKAFLDANNIYGMKYYLNGLLFSLGIYAKLRALSGLFMFCIPFALRKKC